MKFTPNELGDWSYQVIFKKGDEIIFAKNLNDKKWEPIGDDGKTGKFKVVKGDFSEKDFRAKGQLETTEDANYQRFAETGEYFIKGGCGSPENLLAYKDMGEENGPADFSPEGQNTAQCEAMFEYFQQNNPQNLVALHTHSTKKWK